MSPDWSRLDRADLILTNIIAYHVVDEGEERFQTPATGRTNDALIYVLRGAYRFSSETGTELTCGEGQMMFLPRGSIYRHTNCIRPSEMYVAYFSIRETEEVRSLLADADISLISVHDPKSFEERFRRLNELFFSGSASVSEVKAMLYRIIGKLAGEERFRNLSEWELDYIKPALECLSKGNFGSMTVHELAEKCCLSEYSFRELFKKYTGTSPKKYMINQKLDKADILLENTDIPIRAISELCDFESPQYFYRVYKAVRGKTPRAKG